MKKILSILSLLLVCLESYSQIELLKKAAESGDITAQMYLGKVYNEGDVGIKQDLRQSYKWYLMAAKQGNAEAMFWLGSYQCFNQIYFEEDTIAGKEWLKQSADNGYILACHPYGWLLLQESNPLAYIYLKRIVEIDFPLAYTDYGKCYYYGIGTACDYDEAIKYFKKSIEIGVIENYPSLLKDAYLFMGYCYDFGKGVSADYNTAMKFYQKAIDVNNLDGYNQMAYLYAKGRGLKTDFKEAHRLIDIAISESSGNPKYLDSKGEFYLLENKTNEAIEVWNKLKQIAPEVETTIDTEFTKKMRSLILGRIDTDIPINPTNNNSKTFVVIIANETYQRVSDVQYANNDGKLFAEYCQKTLGLPQNHVMVYNDATLGNMLGAVSRIKEIGEAYNGKVNVVLYYAGHGIPDETSRDAYLLPVDGDGSSVRTCYKQSELYAELASIKAESIVVFMDACFSGSLRGDGMLASARGVAIKAKKSNPIGNMVVFSAAQGDETAYPYKEQRHGMFTYYLLKKLQETKGEATLGEISDYVTSEVRKQSIVINGKMQTPTLTSSSVVGDAWRNWKLR